MNVATEAGSIVGAASGISLPGALNSALSRGFRSHSFAIVPSANPSEDCVVASILHLMSAHKYLSASLRAALLNDVAGAQHLAYYAQVRSALSVFAGSGIFLVQRAPGSGSHSFYIDVAGNQNIITNVQTHSAINSLWPSWSQSQSAIDIIGSIEVVSGLSFSRISGAIPGALFIQNFVSDLCFDIMNFASDKRARNTASYEPNQSAEFFLPLQMAAVRRHGNLVSGLRQATSSAKQIDIQIAGFALKKLAASQVGVSPNDIIDDISSATGVSASILSALLVDGAGSRPLIAQLATENVSTFRSMLSRAMILVRLAERRMTLNTLPGDEGSLEALISEWVCSHMINPLPRPWLKEDFAMLFEALVDGYHDRIGAARTPSEIWSVTSSHEVLASTQTEMSLAWA